MYMEILEPFPPSIPEKQWKKVLRPQIILHNFKLITFQCHTNNIIYAQKLASAQLKAPSCLYTGKYTVEVDQTWLA